MLLHDIIINRIQTKGPISFRDFMDMALYYPGLGYYTSEEEKIGKKGDYYTSPHYTSLFGQTIAKQLEEMWHKLGRGLVHIGSCSQLAVKYFNTMCKLAFFHPHFFRPIAIKLRKPIFLRIEMKHGRGII